MLKGEMCILEHKRNFLNVHSQTQQKDENTSRTLRVGAAGDADGFVVNLQTDGTGEPTLHALHRQRAWAAAGLLLLLLVAELCARRDKAPKHRHHGSENGLQLSTNKPAEGEGRISSCCSAASASTHAGRT